MKKLSFQTATELSYAVGKNVCLSKNNWYAPEPLHTHEFYELSYVCDGKGIEIINGVSYTVEKGTLILLSERDSHSFYSVERFTVLDCIFNDTRGLKNLPVGGNAIIVSVPPAIEAEVAALLKVIETEIGENADGGESIIKGCIDALLLIMTRKSHNRILSDPIWGELLTYISEHYDSVTLQEATNIMGMSKSWFCRKFKEQFSVSFLNYINNIRIQNAQRLLTTTQLTIPDIAEKIGYGSNLCRLHEDFKKFTGTTPHKYKSEYIGKPHSET